MTEDRRRTFMTAHRFVGGMRTLVLAMLLLATLVSLAPTASASGDCTDKELGVGPYEVHLYRGDCMSVTYNHPTAKCSEGVDVGVYSGTVVCNGRVVLW